MPKPTGDLLQENAVDERVRIVLEADGGQLTKVDDPRDVVAFFVGGVSSAGASVGFGLSRAFFAGVVDRSSSGLSTSANVIHFSLAPCMM